MGGWIVVCSSGSDSIVLLVGSILHIAEWNVLWTCSESNGQSIATSTAINSNFLVLLLLPLEKGVSETLGGRLVGELACSGCAVVCRGKEVFRKVNPPTLSSRPVLFQPFAVREIRNFHRTS